MHLDEVKLVACKPEYAALWKTWRDQPLTRKFNPISALSVEILQGRLAELSSDLSEVRSEYLWFIQVGKQLVGTVSLKNISRSMNFAEIGYGLDAAFHGRGYGTRAVGLLIDDVFSSTRMHRILAYVAEENLASRKLLEKLGFRLEGLLRNHEIIQGRRINEVLYVMNRTLWTAHASRQFKFPESISATPE